jgi:leader peptidase (prepilin peptidase)/N-methyltransferase
LVEVVTVVAAAALVAAGTRGFELAAYLWFTVMAVPLAVIDATVHRLPDRLVVAAGAGFLVLAGAAGQPGSWVRALAAGGLVLLGLGVLAVLPRTGLGLGDAKFGAVAAMAGGWLSWFAVACMVVVSFLAVGVAGSVLVLARRVGWSSRVPFGPYLAAVTWATVVALMLARR